MSDEKNAQKALDNLTDALVEDILRAPDDEILAEAAADEGKARRVVILTENLPQWQVDEIVEGLKNTKAPPELDELMDD